MLSPRCLKCLMFMLSGPVDVLFLLCLTVSYLICCDWCIDGVQAFCISVCDSVLRCCCMLCCVYELVVESSCYLCMCDFVLLLKIIEYCVGSLSRL